MHVPLEVVLDIEIIPRWEGMVKKGPKKGMGEKIMLALAFKLVLASVE